jgi:predicted DNA-binding protein (MmcQ/YjbR family)
MTPKAVEKFLLSFAGATRSIQWGDDHVFKVGGKMFAVMGPPDNKLHGLSFKAGESSFAILTKQKGIIPAPYLARAHWVQLERMSALSDKELKAYLSRAHALVAAGLSKKKRAALGIAEQTD